MKKILNTLLILVLVMSFSISVFANTEEEIRPYYIGCIRVEPDLIKEDCNIKAIVGIKAQSSTSYDYVKVYARLQQVSTGETVRTWNATMDKSGAAFEWSGTYTPHSKATYRLKVICYGYKDGKLIETITPSDATLKFS